MDERTLPAHPRAGDWLAAHPTPGVEAVDRQDGLGSRLVGWDLASTEDLDVSSAFASSTFTTPSAGKYKFSLDICGTSASYARLALYKNGSRVTSTTRALSGLGTQEAATWIVSASASDTYEWYWYGGGTGTIYGTEAATSGTGLTSLSIEFLGN